MTVWPVITRELRASARQPFTYYVRLLGVAALLFASTLAAVPCNIEVVSPFLSS